jgi:hypothetical protein
MTILHLGKSSGRLPLQHGFLLVPFVLACFALSVTANIAMADQNVSFRVQLRPPCFREGGFNGSYQSFFSNRRDDGADGAWLRSYGQYFWESHASYFQFSVIRIFRFEYSVHEFTGPRAQQRTYP